MIWKCTCLLFAALLPFGTTSPVDRASLSPASQSLKTTIWERSLQKRGCDTLGAVIDTVSSGSEIAVYATTGGVTALHVCRRAHWRECDTMAGSVAGLVASIFLLGKRIAGSKNTDGHIKPVTSMTEFLFRAFSEEGQSFASIENTTLFFLAQNDSPGQRQPLEVSSVKGLSFENSTLDFDVYDFGGGEGDLYMPIGVDNADGSPDKRAAAPAIKISYRTFKRSAFTRHQQLMGSHKISSAWRLAANRRGINNYIGLVESHRRADFYWRIIPEMHGFGTNFERTDICGDLGKWLCKLNLTEWIC